MLKRATKESTAHPVYRQELKAVTRAAEGLLHGRLDLFCNGCLEVYGMRSRFSWKTFTEMFSWVHLFPVVFA